MLHVNPDDDLKPHELTTTCPCQPSVMEENGELIVIHNSYDGREGVEWVNELLTKKKTTK